MIQIDARQRSRGYYLMRMRFALVLVVVLGACSESDPPLDGGTGMSDTGVSGDSAVPGDADLDGDVEGPDAAPQDSGLVDGSTDAGTPLNGLDRRPPNATCRAGDLPEFLSATGCVDPSSPADPAPGVIPFTVNHPLWSDGATKRRWFAIPDGTNISVDATTGDWDFPVGSVLIKEFTYRGRRVETRLIARTGAGAWNASAYIWEAGGGDARLGDGTVDVGGSPWEVPSSGDCVQCHTDGAGFSLGPEHAQLDGPFTYPSTGRTANQVDTLMHIGVLNRRASVPPLPALGSAAPAQAIGRAYIHANCSNCHRPGEEERFDGRWTTPFASQGLCNVVPSADTFGDDRNRLILPGNPNRSIVVRRLSTPDPGLRMPPLGTTIEHTAAVTAISDWIRGLSGCP